ncbi:nuclear transport factor 2 family protein [Shewanella sp. 202IG2-18]|uniref:YybH family protein n=1 Tax=Parashewanella hymeniacidonis TaxID=2807618 RepID=UPI001960440C|nr:nuclear transport factor 2 family protein [Parashewanella hymeniacidonis]MBM7073704.1 nuclear transport factor 2 family protein [Parashewanella hymeniacidonis]
MSFERSAEQELVELSNRFFEYHCQKKTDEIMALFSQDGDIHFWGTGIDEEGTGIDDLRMQFERDFKEVETLRITPETTRVFATPLSGIVTGNWITRYLLKGQTEYDELNLRATLYADVVDGEWRFRHAHWSIAYGSQPEGRSFPEHDEMTITIE